MSAIICKYSFFCSNTVRSWYYRSKAIIYIKTINTIKHNSASFHFTDSVKERVLRTKKRCKAKRFYGFFHFKVGLKLNIGLNFLESKLSDKVW